MNDDRHGSGSRPGIFFGFAYLLTWACWIPAGLLAAEQHSTLVSVLHYAGGAMPMVAALVLLYRSGDHQERRDYWQRLVDLKRVGKAMYAVVFVTVPVLTAVG